jgi:hypothetical protein
MRVHTHTNKCCTSARAHTHTHKRIYGAGGAPRQAQVLLAGRGAPAGLAFLLTACGSPARIRSRSDTNIDKGTRYASNLARSAETLSLPSMCEDGEPVSTAFSLFMTEGVYPSPLPVPGREGAPLPPPPSRKLLSISSPIRTLRVPVAAVPNRDPVRESPSTTGAVREDCEE